MGKEKEEAEEKMQIRRIEYNKKQINTINSF